MIFRVVIVNVGFVSHAAKSSMSAPGWFKQRCQLIGNKPRRHQTAIRGQANVCSHTATALSLHLPGEFERRCAPETSPCHVQAKQNGELDLRRVACFSPGAFVAESRPRRIRDRHRQRIGSVLRGLGTWAASAGSTRSKILGHRRGGQSNAMRSSRRHA